MICCQWREYDKDDGVYLFCLCAYITQNCNTSFARKDSSFVGFEEASSQFQRTSMWRVADGGSLLSSSKELLATSTHRSLEVGPVPAVPQVRLLFRTTPWLEPYETLKSKAHAWTPDPQKLGGKKLHVIWNQSCGNIVIHSHVTNTSGKDKLKLIFQYLNTFGSYQVKYKSRQKNYRYNA